MAADYIPISKTNRGVSASQVIAAANRLVELRDLIAQLDANAQHMHEGGVYTVLESQFNLPAGSGANFLTLLGYMQEIFNTNTDVTGANRLARIEEFCARLSGQ